MRPIVVVQAHNTSAPLDPSASIDLADTDKGFLPNRLTTAQRNTIETPAPGLLIYNTDANVCQFFDGSTWNGIGSPGLVVLSQGLVDGSYTSSVDHFDVPLDPAYRKYLLWVTALQYDSDDALVWIDPDDAIAVYSWNNLTVDSGKDKADSGVASEGVILPEVQTNVEGTSNFHLMIIRSRNDPTNTDALINFTGDGNYHNLRSSIRIAGSKSRPTGNTMRFKVPDGSSSHITLLEWAIYGYT